jgi:hypothetical protein
MGRTTLFTPVDINLEQVVDFLNFYACIIGWEQYNFAKYNVKKIFIAKNEIRDKRLNKRRFEKSLEFWQLKTCIKCCAINFDRL